MHEQKTGFSEKPVFCALLNGFSIKALHKRLTPEIKGLTARIAYQEFTNWEILIPLVVAILGGAAKLFVFCPSH